VLNTEPLILAVAFSYYLKAILLTLTPFADSHTDLYNQA